MSDGGAVLLSAGVSLVVGVGAVIASVWAARLQADQAVKLKREDLRTEYMAETAIHRLLRHPRWSSRTFEAIKERLGDGFDDKELRRLLVRAGAVRLRDRRGEGRELWGLAELNERELD